MVSGATGALGHLALALQRPFRSDETMKEVEKNFKYVGLISNRDKPSYIKQACDMRIIACGALGDGVGIEPTIPMRLDPTATAIHLPIMEVSNSFKSILDIVRIPGIIDVFNWRISQGTETLLWANPVVPVNKTPSNIISNVNYQPLSDFSRFYRYYSGSIKYRFDFVCTQFHTGTIIISYIPYNTSYTYDQAKSGYYKIFDLREQKTVEFDVPYIRTTPIDIVPYFSDSRTVSRGVIPPSPGQIKVWVVNPLTPIQSVSTTIQVIVYKSAGEDFQLSYPVGSEIEDYFNPTQYGNAQMSEEHITTNQNDETENFNKLIPIGARLQVNEDHMNIKDLLRRWRAYRSEYTPQVGTNYLGLTINSGFNTLQDKIIRQYRWSRGGIVILLLSNTPGNIYRIYHAPQGTYFRGMDWTTHTATSYESYASTIWDTNVNSTCKIEIPFNGIFIYNDNLWQSASNESNVEVFDRISFNLGSLILQLTTQNVQDSITTFSRVADDFELYNFVGCNFFTQRPSYLETLTVTFDVEAKKLAESGDIETNPGPTYNAMAQMMESYEEPSEILDFSTRVWGGVKSISSSAIAPVSNTLSAMKNSKLAVESLTKASQAWEKSGETLNSTLEYLKDIAQNITSHVKNSCKWIKNGAQIFNSVLHFLHTFISPKWQTFCLSITGIITSVGNFFAPIGEVLLNFFTSRTHTAEEQPAAGASADAQAPSLDDNDVISLCSLIFGSLSGFLGYRGSAPNMGIWARLMRFNDSFWKTINGATKFLQSFITVVKKMFYWLVQKIPIAREYFTLYSENENICQFINEAQFCLDEVNLQQLGDEPTFKYRFWTTTVMAYRLQKILIYKPEKNTNQLLRLIQKLLDKSNELAISMTSSPVRYEPYVLKISGDTKIGKSFMISETLPELLGKCFGVKQNNPVFTRTPGVEFWNGYKNQKAILYDDFLAVRDPTIGVTQVIELYNLKSTAIMNMNMANINDKQLKGNPYLVTLIQNDGFTVLNGTVQPEAFLRRADMHWRCELHPTYKGKDIRTIPSDIKAKFQHLIFKRYCDPAIAASLEPTTYTYREWKKMVELDMKDYHKREIVNMGRRMKALTKTLPTNVRASLNTVDPYSVFYATNNEVAQNLRAIQTGWLPNDVYEAHTTQLRTFVEAYQKVTNEAKAQQKKNTETAKRVRSNRARRHIAEDEIDPTENFSANIFDEDITVNEDEIVVQTSSGTPIPLLLDPTTSTEADAQFNLNDILDLGKEYLKRVLFVPSSPYERDQIPIGECPVCRDDKELVITCRNSHDLCQDCFDRIQETTPEISCPICRDANIDRMHVRGEWWSRLRVVLWTQESFTCVKRHVKFGIQHPREALRRTRDWLNHSPMGQRVLIGMMAAFYVFYVSRKIVSAQNDYYEATHVLYTNCGISHSKPETQSYLGGFIKWNNWTIDLCGQDIDEVPVVLNKPYDEGVAFIGRYDLPNTLGIPSILPVSSREEDLFGPPPWHGYGGNKPYYNANSQAPVEISKSSEYKRTLPLSEKIPVGLGECPHLQLGKKVNEGDLLDITYEQDFESINSDFGWVVQTDDEEAIWMPDAPCQYPDCWLSHIENRTVLLHTWANARTNLFARVRRDWRSPQVWPLPKEYLCRESENLMKKTKSKIMDQIKSYRNSSWIEKAGDCFGEVYKYIKIIGAIIGGVMTICKGFQFCKWMLGYGQPTSEPQIISSGEIKTHKLNKTNRLPRQATKANSQSNESQVSATERYIERNTFFVQVSYKEGNQDKTMNMRGLGVFGRTGIIPAHYGKYIAKKQKDFEEKRITDLIIIVYPFINKEITILYPDINNNLAYSDSELCFINLPPQFCQFKDLTHMIPTVEEHKNIGGTYVHFEPNPALNSILKVPGKIKGFLNSLTINKTDNFAAYEIFDVYCTTYGTRGACGSVYIADYTKPLFGMHVAGDNSTGRSIGYGIPLIYEDMQMVKEGKAVLSTFIPKVADPQIALPGAIIPITTLKRSETNHLPTKSKIIKSLLDQPLEEALGPAITAPAILSTKDPRWIWDKSPLYWGCIKHTLPPRPFHPEILKDTYDELAQKFITILEPVKSVEPLTIEQAITGFDDVPYFDTLDMSTSVGWPWNVGTKKRKDDWIHLTRDPISNRIINVEIEEELKLNLALKDSLRSRGIKPFTVFLDWLKDERRKQSKLETSGGTRIFSLSPIDFTIQLRQCTLDFTAAMMNKRLEINSIVGISPDGPEWSILANNLTGFSPNIITFDYSDFGPRLPADVGFVAMDIIKDWYAEHANNNFDYAQRLDVMKEELFHSYHLMNDFIYETLCGAPSGAATTVIHNTLVNILMMRYIWRYIILKQGISLIYLNRFDECVKMYLYGDDGIMAVKDSALEFFNLKNIMIAFQEHDVIITDAEKLASRQRGEPIPNLDKIPLCQTIEEATVLKRGFKRHPSRKNHWLAPIDEKSIKETARWCWKSNDHVEATKLNAEQSLMLAYGHGPKYFNNHKNIINKALKSINLEPINLLWNDLDRNFFGVEDILGDFIPNTRLNELFRLSTPSKIEKEKLLDLPLIPNLRQEGQGGLKASLVVLTDEQMNRFNRTTGGGILPSALAWEREENISIPDYQLRGCGDKGVNPLFG